MQRVGQCERMSTWACMWIAWWGSHPYLICKPSFNSDLLRENCTFLSVAHLSSSMLLSVMLDLLSAFVSDKQFP